MTSTDYVSQLITLVPPPAGGPFLEEAAFADLGIQEECGRSTMPDDWRRIVAAYGSGTFDEFIHLYSPNVDNGGATFKRELRETLKLFRDLSMVKDPLPVFLPRQTFDTPMEVPYDIRKGQSQLIPWGSSIDGDTYFFNASVEDPNGWTVAVNLRDEERWAGIRTSISEFLWDVSQRMYPSLVPLPRSDSEPMRFYPDSNRSETI